MTKRYNHSFWHSSFMNWVENKSVSFSSWLWKKRWARENN